MHIVNTMNITNILVMNINVMKINMDVQEMRQSDIENVIGGNDYGNKVESK